MSGTDTEAPLPWYESDSRRLDWELNEFKVRELPARQRLGMRDGRHADCLVVETQLPFKGETVPIEAVYPFEFPDEGPTIYGPPGLVDRHQQPRHGNFCWAEDPDRDWWPGMAAAELVNHDVRWLLEDTEKGPDAVHAGEADMPEPVTGFIAFVDGTVVVPDPFFVEVLPAKEGRMTLVGRNGRYLLARAAGLGEVDSALRERYFPGEPENDGYWVALSPTPAPAVFDNDFVEVIDTAAPRAFGRLQRRLKERKSEAVAETWLGITFMEEGPRRREQRRNWIFARIQVDRRGAKHMYPKLRAQALTLSERQRRIPELAGLRDARVLAVGAGSLGSPLVLELVKAGVGHVEVVDSDVFDVNNSVRHVLPPQCAGSNKATMTALHAQDLNPFVTVGSHDFVVGGGAAEREKLDRLVAEATVVVDTTGAQSVARILQRRCARAGKPLVVASLTAGAYGGEVAVFQPGGPCFYCLVLAQRDRSIPEPAAAPASGQVTPIGCSHPAFAGAGFEATELAAVAARATVQATGGSEYPTCGWDWAVLNFRGEPRWESGRLSRHPGCPHCQ